MSDKSGTKQGLATDLNNLTNLYVNQCKYTETETLLKRAQSNFEEILGKGHPRTKITQANSTPLQKEIKQREKAGTNCRSNNLFLLLATATNPLSEDIFKREPLHET